MTSEKSLGKVKTLRTRMKMVKHEDDGGAENDEMKERERRRKKIKILTILSNVYSLFTLVAGS